MLSTPETMQSSSMASLFAVMFPMTMPLPRSTSRTQFTLPNTRPSHRTSRIPAMSPTIRPVGPMIRFPVEIRRPSNEPSTRRRRSKCISPFIFTLRPMTVSGSSSCSGERRNGQPAPLCESVVQACSGATTTERTNVEPTEAGRMGGTCLGWGDACMGDAAESFSKY